MLVSIAGALQGKASIQQTPKIRNLIRAPFLGAMPATGQDSKPAPVPRGAGAKGRRRSSGSVMLDFVFITHEDFDPHVLGNACLEHS